MAYVLRQHEVFQSPLPVALKDSISIKTPAAWSRLIPEDSVRVLPLVNNKDRHYPDGWCTYTYEHVQAPELEIICGGVNAKTPAASAVWRQGHLMHFGFEQSPAEMNANGRALLVNSICYVARFTEDRPLVRTPSVFYSRVRLVDRGAIDRLVENQDRDLDTYLDWYLGGNARRATKDMNREELARWYRSARGFLRADSHGKLLLDEEAKKFGVAPDSQDFIPSAIDAIASGEGVAERLLQRYVPHGPDSLSVDEWKGWWNENRKALFFSDTGGFRWYTDALAKKRNVDSRELRGVARATKKAIDPVARP